MECGLKRVGEASFSFSPSPATAGLSLSTNFTFLRVSKSLCEFSVRSPRFSIGQNNKGCGRVVQLHAFSFSVFFKDHRYPAAIWQQIGKSVAIKTASPTVTLHDKFQPTSSRAVHVGSVVIIFSWNQKFKQRCVATTGYGLDTNKLLSRVHAVS